VANTGNAVIDAPTFQAAMVQFQDLLAQNEQLLNDLNVYPVPDSDTGSNTLHTFKAGMANTSGQATDLDEFAMALAMGAAKSAVGNSGVILAQYLQGLAQGLSRTSIPDQCSPSEWQIALQQASIVARESVLTPAEGTMLTVADAATNVAAQLDFQKYYQAVQSAVRTAVIETQNLLPELKAAEVIDSGALALSFFHESFAIIFGASAVPLEIAARKPVAASYSGPTFELMFSVVCSQLIKEEIETKIANLGESIAISGVEPDYNFHIHTNEPDKVIASCEHQVEITNIRISELGN
jgi:dihydroxyacetone kinase-like predicted kinase